MRPMKAINLGALGVTPEGAPLPKIDGALYRHPNPDGTSKACRNCVMFIEGYDRCVIHLPDQVVEASDWCGYHIFGAPMKEPMVHEGMQAVTPDISGLRKAGTGIACGSCRFYEDQGGGMGLCHGVSRSEDRKPPVPVQTYGVCARFEVM